MIRTGLIGLCIVAVSAVAHAAPQNRDIGQSDLNIGEPGIAWYTTWDTGAAEAERSGRPILFMAAATVCQGVSGIF